MTSTSVEWKGVFYSVPNAEPPQDRDPAGLHPIFRSLLLTYVTHAQESTPYEIRLGECRRTLERQIWLYSQGRTRPGRVVSRTLESRHLHGLACDLVMVNRETGAAVWEAAAWQHLYDRMPPEWFGLKDLRPMEFVHTELAYADAVIARAAPEAGGLSV